MLLTFASSPDDSEGLESSQAEFDSDDCSDSKSELAGTIWEVEGYRKTMNYIL